MKNIQSFVLRFRYLCTFFSLSLFGKVTLLIGALCTLLINNLSAQSSASQDASLPYHKNAISLQLGGPAIFYDVHYERTLYYHSEFSLVGSLGFCYMPSSKKGEYAMLFPLEFDAIYKMGNFALEGGLALTTDRDKRQYDPQGVMFIIVPRIGVRFFSKNQHWEYRMGVTPIFPLNSTYEVLPDGSKEYYLPSFPWLNLFSVGYRF